MTGVLIAASALLPFTLDLDIELLSADNTGTGNICETQRTFSIFGAPPQAEFSRDDAELTCSNADAINLLNNELIRIGDDKEEFVNFEDCNPEENPQCQAQYLYLPRGSLVDRIVQGVALRYTSPILGQSSLR